MDQARTRPTKRRAAVAGDPPKRREGPIVRRASEPTSRSAASVPERRLVAVVESLATVLSGSARAIEIDALREHLASSLQVELAAGTVSTLVAQNKAARGWHTAGTLVSRRPIPWAGLGEAVAAAAAGARREPAEVVARARRLVRITNATALALRQRLQRGASTARG